jgi:nucleotide-binding universal stress UspA family protein
MKRLLIAYDGSEASIKAIDMAVRCSTHDDEIVLLTVIPAALVESTFTNMLLPTIDLSTVVTPGTF